MKHLNFLAVALMAGMNLQAQHYVNLCFTAQMQGGSFQALDSVKITNVTRGWTETLCYPDTVLQLTNQTGITETKNRQNSLLQNVPNPFDGSTEVNVLLSAKEKIGLNLYDMSGKQYGTYSGTLAEGKHTFKISVGASQAYVLKLTTSEGEQSIKLMASQGSKNFRITYKNSEVCSINKQFQKAVSDKEFQTGDKMNFVGYSTYDSAKKISQLSITQTGSDAKYTFQFAIWYAVGDVYYNEKGIAEGIVCWIADTVFNESGQYFGSTGKIISLDERDTATYATIDCPTYALDSMDGRVNTAIHKALLSDTSTYLFKERLEAAKWCLDKGEGWYLPAKCELIQVFKIIKIINNVIETAGGEKIHIVLDEDFGLEYWTSTEDPDGKNAFDIYMINENIRIKVSPFYGAFHVRAMKWF